MVQAARRFVSNLSLFQKLIVPFAILVAVILAIAGQSYDGFRALTASSHLEKHYHPTDVFLGGIAGYTHEYFPSDDPVCDQWEYPDGRPAASAHPD